MLSEADRDKFLALIDRMNATYGKHEDIKRARSFWQAMHFYSISEIESALDAHIGDPGEGRFYPTPAHLISRIPAANQRPSAAEAWALALKSFDERASVLLTDEILQARNAALPIFDSGDEIGARLAFVAAYERVVRASNAPPRWFPSLGHDAGERPDVVASAKAAGLISAPQASHLLPSSQDGGVIGAMLTALPNLTAGETKPDQRDADAETVRRLRKIIDGVNERAEQEQRERRERNAAQSKKFAEQRNAAITAIGFIEDGKMAEAREAVASLNPEA